MTWARWVPNSSLSDLAERFRSLSVQCWWYYAHFCLSTVLLRHAKCDMFSCCSQHLTCCRFSDAFLLSIAIQSIWVTLAFLFTGTSLLIHLWLKAFTSTELICKGCYFLNSDYSAIILNVIEILKPACQETITMSWSNSWRSDSDEKMGWSCWSVTLTTALLSYA